MEEVQKQSFSLKWIIIFGLIANFILPPFFKITEYGFSLKAIEWDFSAEGLIVKTVVLGAMILGVWIGNKFWKVK